MVEEATYPGLTSRDPSPTSMCSGTSTMFLSQASRDLCPTFVDVGLASKELGPTMMDPAKCQ